MALRLNTALRNTSADTIGSVFNGGTLEIRSGAQPASANDADAGTLLATIPLPADAFAAPASGAVAKNGTWSDTVDTGGIAGHGRFKNVGNTQRMDVSIGEGTGDLSLDETTLVAGGTVTVTAFTITQPSGE